MPKDITAIPALISDLRTARGLFGPKWPRRTSAARRLGELRAEEAVPHLIAVADSPANQALSRACADALGCIGGEDATAALGRWLVDPARDDVRLACLLGLARIGDEPARAALAQVNGIPARRSEAIGYLRVELERANGDEPRRELASEALLILTGAGASGGNGAHPALDGEAQFGGDGFGRLHAGAGAESAPGGEGSLLNPADLETLSHPDGRARRRAAASLMQGDGPEVEWLRPMLSLWGGAGEAPQAPTVSPVAEEGVPSLEEVVASARAGTIVRLEAGE
jgi:hypothetical protein